MPTRLLGLAALLAALAGCIEPLVTMQIVLERPSIGLGELPAGQVRLSNAGPESASVVRVDAEDIINEVRRPDGRQVFRRPPSILVVGEYGPQDLVQVKGGESIAWPLQGVLHGYSFDQAGVWRLILGYDGSDFESIPGTNWKGLAKAEASIEVRY